MINSPQLTQLMNVGLSDKEARVYLASLELGPSTVQSIAQKSTVKRATTYVAVESLIDRGLMSSFKKGKKSFFSATNPEQLESIINEQKYEIEKKEEAVKTIIDDLKALAAFSSNSPRVSYYEGWDGINSLREDILRSDVHVARELVSLDEAKKVLSKESITKDTVKKAFRKKVAFKTLYTSQEGRVLPQKNGESEARFLSKEKFPLSCEVVIYGNNVAFLMYSGKPTGILISDNNVALTMTSMFDGLWSAAE